MANAARGEVELRLGDETYTLRPTFAALCAIESELGRGILRIADDMANRQICIKDMASIIAVTARAAGHQVDEAGIGDGILQVGLISVIPAVLDLLRKALTGPSE